MEKTLLEKLHEACKEILVNHYGVLADDFTDGTMSWLTAENEKSETSVEIIHEH